MRPADLLTSRLGTPFLVTDGLDHAGPAPADTDSHTPIPLPDLDACIHQPVLLILLFDNSPSITGGNDPVGNRFEEARLALTHYSRRCRCGEELVVLRTFDPRTSRDLGPVRLKGAGRRTVTSALGTPPELVRGTSRLGPSLAGAERLAQAYPDHRAVLVVFSDFKLLDPDPAAVLDRLIAYPGLVHAVVLSEPPPEALAETRVVITPVSQHSRRGDVARAVLAALTDVADRGTP